MEITSDEIKEFTDGLKELTAEDIIKIHEEILKSYDKLCQTCGGGIEPRFNDLYGEGFCDSKCKEIYNLKMTIVNLKKEVNHYYNEEIDAGRWPMI